MGSGREDGAMGRRWTSRQRLLTAFECGIPDRVPVNTYELAGFDSRDWYNLQPSYSRLMDLIRRETDCITNWNPSALPAARSAGGEASAPGTAYLDHCLAESGAPLKIERTRSRRGRRERIVEEVGTPAGPLRRIIETDPEENTIWQVEHWCKDGSDVDKVLSIPYEPLRYDAGDLPRARAELGERGLVMASLGDPAYIVADLMSMEDFLVWAFSDTGHFGRAVAVVSERVMENLRQQLDTCVVDAYRICGPEYFTPPYHPPEMFERFVLPHVKEMVGIVQRRGAKVRIHCHGKIARVLDMIIETGCDGIDPCEPPPAGDITLDEVKRRCLPAGVSVWGAMQAETLEFSGPAEVRRQVKQCMDMAKEGGGYVFLPCAAPISSELSPGAEAGYRAMIEAALEFGAYD